MQTLVYQAVTQECTIIVSNTPVLVPGTHEVTLLADLDLVAHHCPEGQHYALLYSPLLLHPALWFPTTHPGATLAMLGHFALIF